MLLINTSNREKNCYKVLNDIKKENDTLISLSNKDIKFCLGCGSCSNDLERHCVLNDYITNEVYDKILENEDIVIATPLYMSNINAIFKNLLDRMNPFYHHGLLKNKNIYLVLTGGGSKEDNEEEIKDVIKYFKGISEWLYFNFEFLDYFTGYNDLSDDLDYDKKINEIKSKLINR
jgi:multimeric flavodoxin WrbA